MSLRISIDPEVCRGQACVEGTRIPVHQIVRILANGDTIADREQSALLQVLPTLPGHVILVSNEVGLGIVPDNALARRFRDRAGELHQRVASLCRRVTFTVAGLPWDLKNE